MSWLGLKQTLPRKEFRRITLAEIAKHRTAESAWMVIRGLVFDVTPYLRFHPGGVEKLLIGAGRDATSLFDKYHHWVNAQSMLDSCIIGCLVEEEESNDSD